MSREAVIVDSVRTALAKAHRGSFNMTRPDDQLAHCLSQLFVRNKNVDMAEVGDAADVLRARQRAGDRKSVV